MVWFGQQVLFFFEKVRYIRDIGFPCIVRFTGFQIACSKDLYMSWRMTSYSLSRFPLGGRWASFAQKLSIQAGCDVCGSTVWAFETVGNWLGHLRVMLTPCEH